jgi:hypothetical protein
VTGSVATMSGALDRLELSTGTSRQPSSCLAFCGDHLFDDLLACARSSRPAAGRKADGIVADRRKFDALFRPFLAEEVRIGNLHQHAGAVAHQRIGADGAAMGQVFQHLQAVATMLCDFSPFMWAMKPTPQASCSLRGS